MNSDAIARHVLLHIGKSARFKVWHKQITTRKHKNQDTTAGLCHRTKNNNLKSAMKLSLRKKLQIGINCSEQRPDFHAGSPFRHRNQHRVCFVYFIALRTIKTQLTFCQNYPVCERRDCFALFSYAYTHSHSNMKSTERKRTAQHGQTRWSQTPQEYS